MTPNTNAGPYIITSPTSFTDVSGRENLTGSIDSSPAIWSGGGTDKHNDMERLCFNTLGDLDDEFVGNGRAALRLFYCSLLQFTSRMMARNGLDTYAGMILEITNAMGGEGG